MIMRLATLLDVQDLERSTGSRFESDTSRPDIEQQDLEDVMKPSLEQLV